MQEFIIEAVVSDVTEQLPVILPRETAIPGTNELNIAYNGAVIKMAPVQVVNPKTGQVVDVLSLTIDGQVQLIIPASLKADFAPKKRRSGGARAKAAANGSRPSQANVVGSTGSAVSRGVGTTLATDPEDGNRRRTNGIGSFVRGAMS